MKVLSLLQESPDLLEGPLVASRIGAEYPEMWILRSRFDVSPCYLSGRTWRTRGGTTMDRLPGWENFKWAYIFVFIWAGCFTGALVASMLESAGIIDTQSAALADRILYRGFLGALAGIILGAISGLHTVLSAISERAKEKRKRERDDGQS